MKKRKSAWLALASCLFFGCVICGISERPAVVSADVVEKDVSENITYNTKLYVTETMNLHGHKVTVNGDLEIAADIVLEGGALVVNGNVLHTNGAVIVDKGSMLVTGDYRIQDQKMMPDGSMQYAESSGRLRMQEDAGLVQVNGNFIMQSSQFCYGNNYTERNAFSAGTLEIGGDFTQLNGNKNNFDCSGSHKVVLTGKKLHRVSVESPENKFANLESEGTIEWDGPVRILNMLSDLDVQPKTETGLEVFGLGVNGKYLAVQGNVTNAGDIDLAGGTIKINGTLLHRDGCILLGHGTMDISGDYRIQDVKNLPGGDLQYMESNGRIRMLENAGLLKIGGDFVTQSAKYCYGNQYSEYNAFYAGTMEVHGNFSQLNGNGSNFVCQNSHKVILNGSGRQKVSLESSDAQFAVLSIANPIDAYDFSRTPCWSTLEQPAVSISECTIQDIPKKSYTGKACRPEPVITCHGTRLVQGSDYTVSYKNNKNTGKAVVQITGIGAYTGQAETTFLIVPEKVKNVTAAPREAKAVIKWSKSASAGGYSIEYSLDKSFKKNVSRVSVNKNGTASAVISKLKSRKTYYVRIRAYQTIDQKKVYGNYSSIVKVKIK